MKSTATTTLLLAQWDTKSSLLKHNRICGLDSTRKNVRFAGLQVMLWLSEMGAEYYIIMLLKMHSDKNLRNIFLMFFG